MMVNKKRGHDKVAMVYEEYSGTMLALARSIVGDCQQAEDVVIEAFVRIISNIDKIDEIRSPETRAFVVIVVRNIALDLIKTRKGHKFYPLEEYSEELCYDDLNFDNITSREGCEQITKCIRRLPQLYVDIIYLQVNFGYSFKEMGDILGISPENARVRLSRARKALLEELRKEDIVP